MGISSTVIFSAAKPSLSFIFAPTSKGKQTPIQTKRSVFFLLLFSPDVDGVLFVFGLWMFLFLLSLYKRANDDHVVAVAADDDGDQKPEFYITNLVSAQPRGHCTLVPRRGRWWLVITSGRILKYNGDRRALVLPKQQQKRWLKFHSRGWWTTFFGTCVRTYGDNESCLPAGTMHWSAKRLHRMCSTCWTRTVLWSMGQKKGWESMVFYYNEVGTLFLAICNSFDVDHRFVLPKINRWPTARSIIVSSDSRWRRFSSEALVYVKDISL